MPDPARTSSFRILRTLEQLFQVEATGGFVLLGAALLALWWANSPWGLTYEHVWNVSTRLAIAGREWELTPRFLTNEGLMTVFFLFAGLEIRRELHEGALSGLRRAVIPVAGALGGVIAPAMIYLALTTGAEMRRGWAIPTATDIAFAIGILTILGRRVPADVRVFLLSLAVIDDIVAVLLIATFYSSGLHIPGLLVALAGIVGVIAFQRCGIRAAFPYVLPAAIIWVGLLHGGVHPALSGVILGLLTPVTDPISNNESLPPVDRVQLALHPWVAYGVMPLFAFANAGVRFEGVHQGGHGVITSAIVLALVLGKPVGILSGTWVATRTRLGVLPPGLNWRGVVLAGLLGGIGFTMSILIADLAFGAGTLLSAAKLAVLCGSAVAAGAGLLIGRFWLFRTGEKPRHS